MTAYENLESMYEDCIKMAKKFLEKNDTDMAIFWKNAAKGCYHKMQQLVISDLLKECA